ncbi:alpha/beta fold hydrolase [Seonamhaeicola algicola]|uniref:Alpha/beta fold hydrolase n=1 Tax=Seonamhaeicola algicola TaxID=1719036 RepID=A0A5C7B198_9FLAO|nr:alpha/beta fold hydrolase [Seonamhaeicola algicola]TXE14960.1 alpha/beta fold hydrolase [Seonamhaeicola algicola]
MPVINSTYKAPFMFKNGFVSTVYSGLVRRVNGVEQKRERINLPDGDFLDLDWSYSEEKTNKLIIILHGLEGNAQRPYMLGTAKLFTTNNFDAVCVNFRGCSGEDNKLYRSYHSGATEDLHDVVNHVISKYNYSHIYLKGISLGANIILKYLGEQPAVPQIKGAVTASVPCYLSGSSAELHKLKNKAYAIRFLKHLKERLKLKLQTFPDALSIHDVNNIKTLKDFDDVYTAKAHGFINAEDYYAKSSSLQFIPNIKVPTLIINALNDSFLSAECYPVKEAKTSEFIFLEMPNHGGHVAFIDKKNVYYNERRALEFVKQHT